MAGMYSHPAIVDRHIAALKAERSDIAVAACVSEINQAVPNEIQLLPAGAFVARDGRPGKGLQWQTNAAIASAIIDRLSKLKGDLPIDYEHQTLLADENGKPAPAAGWFSGAELVWREGDGLYALNVRWTDKAKEHIAAGEYRYISPVIEYDRKTGAVLGIQMAALTNYPAIDGLSDLTARAAAKFSGITDDEENPVKKEALLKLLGLKDDATDAEIQTALEALKAKADKADELGAEVEALKGKKDGEVDLAKYVPIAVVEGLQNDVAALKKQVHAGEVDEVIEQAKADGKLLPAMEQWARDLGAKDLASLKSFIEKSPVVEALKGQQTKGKAPEGAAAEGELDEAALKVCKQMGISPDEYKKTLAASNAA